MLYASLVGPAVSVAYTRLSSDYNFAGYPSVFFDGGYDVVVGGGVPMEGYYRPRIVNCGARTVETLDLVTDLEWLGDGEITVTVKIGNGVTAGGTPNTPTAPTLPGFILPGACIPFQMTTTDPEGHELHYQIDNGDGTTSDWIGPYASGATANLEICLSNSGDFDIRVRVRDEWFAESDWSPATAVTVNSAPVTPVAPSGPTWGFPGDTYQYDGVTTDINGNDVYYQYDWDDGTKLSEWYGPFNSGVTCQGSHIWAEGGTYQVRVHAKDEYDLVSDWSNTTTTIINSAPAIPAIPDGPVMGLIDESYEFSAQTSEPNNNQVLFQFDWDDGSMSEWLGPFLQSATCFESHIWTTEDTYDVMVRAKDTFDATSDWSSSASIVIWAGCCVGADRGNVDGDGLDEFNISDVVYLVNYMFKEGPLPTCLEEADVATPQDPSVPEDIDIADLVYLVNFMFKDGDPLPPCH